MSNWQIAGLCFTVATGLISVLAGLAALHDYVTSFSISKMSQEGIPIRIRRSIRYTQFEAAMKKMAAILDEGRFKPDVIIGIHYQGTAFAATLGKMMYVPILPAVVKYGDDAGKHTCVSVTFPFNANARLKGKRVLLVDNSMRSGKTMQLARDEVMRFTKTVKTMVVVQKYGSEDPFVAPDYVLFRALKPITFLR